MKTAAAALALVLLAQCASGPSRRALAEEYYNLGNANLAAGKVQRALALFDLAMRTDSDILQAHYNLSLALLKAGKGDQAVKMLTDLLARDPDNLMILSLLGYCAYQLGRYDEALARYERILERSPGDRDARYNKALVLRKTKRGDEAVTMLEAVADRAPADDLALEALTRLAEIHREAQAWGLEAAALERYLEWKPQSADVLLQLAAAYRRQEKYLPAIEAYRKAAGIAPDKLEAWFGQAELLLTVIEDPEAGLAALERALGGGFKERSRINALLADPKLLEKDRVRAILTRWNVLDESKTEAPAPAAQAAAPATQAMQATPAAQPQQ
jgi:tetratricopeptide (TPR) repeat protein